jgi:hypothetical protein
MEFAIANLWNPKPVVGANFRIRKLCKPFSFLPPTSSHGNYAIEQLRIWRICGIPVTFKRQAGGEEGYINHPKPFSHQQDTTEEKYYMQLRPTSHILYFTDPWYRATDNAQLSSRQIIIVQAQGQLFTFYYYYHHYCYYYYYYYYYHYSDVIDCLVFVVYVCFFFSLMLTLQLALGRLS